MSYCEIEKILNGSPASISLHDQGVCNLRFYKKNIYIRFVQAYYNDTLGILKNDNEFALLDLVLYDIDIVDMTLGNAFNFVDSEVLRNKYENGTFYLYLEDSYNDECFSIHLKFKSFKWKVFKVVDTKEYYKYVDDVKNLKINEIVLPNGSVYQQKAKLGLFDEVESDMIANCL